MRDRIKNMMLTVTFITLGIGIFFQLSELLRLKVNTGADSIHSVYSLKKDSVDVVFVGSSHVYCSIQPNILWHDYGITSYCMASPQQSIPMSYYVIKEIFRVQNPKVIVLDAYATWRDDRFPNDTGEKKDYTRLHQTMDALRYSSVKQEMLNDFVNDMEYEEKIQFYIPFIKYHSRWSDLKDCDLYISPHMKGSVLRHKVYVQEEVSVPDEYGEIPDIAMDYFQKIVDLCRENNVELFVVQSPYGIYHGNDWPTFTEDALSISNTFFKYLDEEGINNKFFQKTGEIDFDWSSDFSDWTHLNVAGMTKYTQFIGEYLKSNYQLKDHRGDPEYSQWDIDYEKYLQTLSTGESQE